MSWLLWILVVLAGLPLLVLLVAMIVVTIVSKVAQRGEPDEEAVLEVNGARLLAQLRYEHWLARRLKTKGVAMDRNAWFYYAKAEVTREILAHELLHLVVEFIVGRLWYKLRSIVQRLTQWVHNRRGTEEEVRRATKELAATGRVTLTIHGRVVTVVVPALKPTLKTG